jgi:thioredoxin-like negative regulator of GroEL
MAVAVIVIIGALYWLANRKPVNVYLQIPPRQGASVQQEEFSGSTVQEEPTKLVLFYAPWCPHCKSFMDGEGSIWDQLKRKRHGRGGLVMDQINCEEKPELATKFGIKGFPTILKINKDKTEQYEGDRSLASIEGFIGSA